MRDLYECRNEIFLRSHRRIHRRRQVRKGILACCIPLVLCVAGIGILRGNDVTDGAGNRPEAGGVQFQSPGVYISGQESYGQINDPNQVEQISCYLSELFRADSYDGTDQNDGQTLPPKGETDSIAQRYTIRITEWGKETQQYTLERNWLYDHQTHRGLELTDIQLARLKDILGLT